MFQKFKKIFKSKKAVGSVSTAIKVVTSIVLGALLLVGIYGAVKGVVLPNVNHKVDDMYQQEFVDTSGAWNSGDTVEELKSKYEFKYYSALELAVADVNASTPGENADSTELVAEAGIYEREDGTSCVVLLKDVDKTDIITFLNDIEFNLGGHKLNVSGVRSVFESPYDGGYNICINGNLKGSEINIGSYAGQTRAIFAKYNNWTVTGGTYNVNNVSDKSTYGIIMLGNSVNDVIKCANVNVNGNGGQTIGIYAKSINVNIENFNVNVVNNRGENYGVVAVSSNVNMNSCSVDVKNLSYDDSRTMFTSAIQLQGTDSCVFNISNCSTTARSHAATARGLYASANTNFTINANNSSFVAYNDYVYRSGVGYIHSSQGICVASSTTTTVLRDCRAFGTHSGFESYGAVEIVGGAYSGVGHGGLYLSNDSIIKNATIKEAEMPFGYDTMGADFNNAAMYVGEISNTSIYVDNCKFIANNTYTSAGRTIVLRNTSGETNNKLYISNSVLDKRTIRIDVGNKVFIGSGNNFTLSDIIQCDAGAKLSTISPDCYEATSETYCQ